MRGSWGPEIREAKGSDCVVKHFFRLFVNGEAGVLYKKQTNKNQKKKPTEWLFKSSLCKNHRSRQPKSKAACQLPSWLGWTQFQKILGLCYQSLVSWDNKYTGLSIPLLSRSSPLLDCNVSVDCGSPFFTGKQSAHSGSSSEEYGRKELARRLFPILSSVRSWIQMWALLFSKTSSKQYFYWCGGW